MFSPVVHLTLGSASPLPSAPREVLANLVARARHGETAAQAALVHRYHARIAGFVRSIVADRSAVEDLTQVVFIKMMRQVPRLRDPAVFEPWLFALARHSAYDHLRRCRRAPPLLALDAEPLDLPAPGDERALDEIGEILEAALARLLPKDRRLVTLIVEGNSYEVIAARTGLTAGGVRARLARLRPYLRAFIGGALGTHHPDPKHLRSIRLLPIAA